MKKILLITDDLIGTQMAGVGIRYFELAKTLAEADFEVILAAKFIEPGFKVKEFKLILLKELLENGKDFEQAQIIITPNISRRLILKAIWQKWFDFACPERSRRAHHKKILIFDLYGMAILESQTRAAQKNLESSFKLKLLAGDHFLIANSRQQDFWTGFLTNLGRTRGGEPADKWFTILPTGSDTTRFQSSANKPWLVWGGGVWSWLDILTPIKGMAEVVKKIPQARLIILGSQPPGPYQFALKNELQKLKELLKNLDLEKNIIFENRWLSYKKRLIFLAAKGAGIVSAPFNLETRFAHRTRTVDYLAAGLPVLASRGDYLSEVVHNKKLGLVFEPGNSFDFAQKAIRLLSNKNLRTKIKANIKNYQKELSWQKTAGELIEKLNKNKIVFSKKPLFKILKHFISSP